MGIQWRVSRIWKFTGINDSWIFYYKFLIMKKNTLFAFFCKQNFVLSISCILLLIDPQPLFANVVLFFLSLLVARNPVNLIPLIFISAISTSIVVIPRFAAVFYYTYLFFFAYLVKHRFKFKWDKNRILIILFALWILLGAYNSITGEVFLVYRLLALILPLVLCTSCKLNITSLISGLLTISVVSSVYILYKILFNPVLFLPGEGALNYSYSSELVQLTIAREINPNTLAQFLLIIYLILFTFYLEIKKRILLLFCFISLISVLIIGSRTIFLSLLMISFILFMNTSSISKIKKIFIITFFLIMGQVLLNFVIDTNNRLAFDTIIENKGSGRFDTWNSLFSNVIPNNFIMGIGYGRQNLTHLGYDVDADNLYVDILTQLGIVGFILFFVIYLRLLKYVYNLKDFPAKVAFSLLLFILFAGLGETVFDTFIYWIIIFYTLLILNNKQILN